MHYSALTNHCSFYDDLLSDQKARCWMSMLNFVWSNSAKVDMVVLFHPWEMNENSVPTAAAKQSTQAISRLSRGHTWTSIWFTNSDSFLENKWQTAVPEENFLKACIINAVALFNRIVPVPRHDLNASGLADNTIEHSKVCWSHRGSATHSILERQSLGRWLLPATTVVNV